MKFSVSMNRELVLRCQCSESAVSVGVLNRYSLKYFEGLDIIAKAALRQVVERSRNIECVEAALINEGEIHCPLEGEEVYEWYCKRKLRAR